jgi:hypothetical protein
MILTGQAQSAGYSQSQFKLCNNLVTFFDCTNGIYINVQNFSSFAGVAATNPIDGSGNFVNNFSYSPGGSGSIVLVQSSICGRSSSRVLATTLPTSTATIGCCRAPRRSATSHFD